MIKAIQIGLLITIFSIPTFAQNGGFAGASNRIGFGPVAMGMGNSVAATTSQGTYAIYNPALAAIKTDYFLTDFSVASLSYDRIFQTAGVSFSLPPSAGLSINLIRSGVNNIDGRTISGYPTESFDASEYQLHTAFAIRMSEKLNAGIGFKINYANYHPELDASMGVGIDLGFLYHINPAINLGFTIQDLFAEYRWDSSDLYGQQQSRKIINKYPTRFKWALAYQQEKYTISGEYEVQALTSESEKEELFISGGRPSIISSITELKTNAQLFRLGGSWNAHERITIRGGYNLTDLSNSDSWGASSGFSVYLPFDKFSPAINYAFVIEPNQVSNMHVFSLTLKL